MKLLGIDTNAKTVKGQAQGYMTAITYLAPAKEAGFADLCASASDGCRAACLFTSGRGAMDKIKQARIAKTVLWFKERDFFKVKLVKELIAFEKKASRKGMRPVLRLNGTTDIMWERQDFDGKNVFDCFPSIQAMDYTKHFNRMLRYLKGELPANYHLTFSRSEKNDAECRQVLASGGNVAVVFKGGLPETWEGYPVVDGDKTDLRFLDPKNVVVGLKAKGKALKDKSGFVIDSATLKA